MKHQSWGPRLDVGASAVMETAAALGWEVASSEATSTSGRPQASIAKSGAPSAIVADLARLVEAAVAKDWWLSSLAVTELSSTRAAVSVTFAGGSRVSTSRLSSEAAERRRSSGRPSGRPPSIGPELVGRIVAAKEAGSSYRGIAADLEAAGVPRPGGAKAWYASTVRAAYLRGRASG